MYFLIYWTAFEPFCTEPHILGTYLPSPSRVNTFHIHDLNVASADWAVRTFVRHSFLIFLCLSAMETLCIQVILYLLLSRSLLLGISSLIYSTLPPTFVTIIFFALPFCDALFHIMPYCVLNCINHQLLARFSMLYGSSGLWHISSVRQQQLDTDTCWSEQSMDIQTNHEHTGDTCLINYTHDIRKRSE